MAPRRFPGAPCQFRPIASQVLFRAVEPIWQRPEATISRHDDEQLAIAAILDGNFALFHDLIRPYERIVYSLAYSLLRNEMIAEEVAIEVFLSAFRKLVSLRGERSLDNRLIGITIERACNRLRQMHAEMDESRV